MEKRTIRILGIAPYEAMKSAMQNLARSRDDLVLDVFLGDLDEGVRIVRQNLQPRHDVIISRGGTAQKISEVTSVPVVEINLSVYDILRAIKLAENYSEKYAVVGFPSITQSAYLLCSLLQYKIDIVTIHHEEEAFSVVSRLKREGYRMLLCDMIASTVAKTLGLNAILITSGTESIENAFDQAVKLAGSFSRIQREKNFFSQLLRTGTSLVVLNRDGEPLYSFWEADKELPEDEILNLLKEEAEETFRSGSHKCLKPIGGTLYSITGKVLAQENADCCVFHIAQAGFPIVSGKNGIFFWDKKRAEESFFNSFFSITSASNSAIQSFAKNLIPVMITGEYGTGKSKAARAIYAQGSLSSNPLVALDFDSLSGKNLDFLLNHHNSPFNDNGLNIYFKNADRLPQEQLHLLLSRILDTNLAARNRLIFSCTVPAGQPVSSGCLLLMDRLKCLTLNLPPLRQLTDDIPALTSLYLGTLNPELPQSIIGLEPDAMELMQSYPWPGNFPQFKRVLKQLAALSPSPYICANDVKKILAQEYTISFRDTGAVHSGFQINLNQTLEEITCDIIRQVLADTNSNQSAAAKRLGISRTTLWRYLNR